MPEDKHWEFWIDVGGTFTDCIAQKPDGSVARHKVLSSAITKGTIEQIASNGREIVVSGRRYDPDGFWDGYRFRLIDSSGNVEQEAVVESFDRRAARFLLSKRVAAERGQACELLSGEASPVLAIRRLMGLGLSDEIPPLTLKLGTTRGTNALLTRSGARTALVTTRGFGDILRIGYQNRPRLFELTIRKPEPLFETVVEVGERVTQDGRALERPNVHRIKEDLYALRSQGIESLGVCLLNSYCQPAHEQLVGKLAREVGFTEVSLSHEVAPLIKLVSRGDTTIVDAYLNPVLRSYVNGLRTTLDGQGRSDLRLLTSAGGLVRADGFVGKDSILSGPAGGVVGFSRVALAAGFERAIGFDMGGTSTDVSRYDGRYELEYETEKAGVRIVSPMMAIETVAAGGGSICHFDGVKLAVGPDSAGADPGPACYGRGGPLTVTDVNFYLGRLLRAHFPFPLDQNAVNARLGTLVDDIERKTGRRFHAGELAEGFLKVANTNMANAVRSISVTRGYDPRQYVLVAFGGAAPQHACAVADELGMTSVLNHPDAGILSAYGIGMADVVRHASEGVYEPYSQSAMQLLDGIFERLERRVRDDVRNEGVPEGQITVVRSLDLRYQGQDASLTISQPTAHSYAKAFASEHQRRYGYVHPNRGLEIVAAKVQGTGASSHESPRSKRVERYVPRLVSQQELHHGGRTEQAAVYRRDRLQPGDFFAGPALVLESVSTTVIDAGWTAEMLSGGELLITKIAQTGQVADDASCGSASGRAQSDEADPALLEIFNNQFASIAEQMGITLRNTSSSVNVKERLDFSCALFTATGDLVVNAPHIPVHLGAMGETVRQIIADNAAIQPGDVFVTNDPYKGGSHLPDITVVTPIHDTARRQLLFFTASRAHHAELGGISPGSMPPFSKNLGEEGVLISNFKLVDRGESRFDQLKQLLCDSPFPSRSPEDNLADLTAQVAANQQGAYHLAELIERYTLPVVQAYMSHIQTAAEEKMRQALARLPDGRHEFTDHLDDGAVIHVAVTVQGDSAVIDFTGTGAVLANNLNANRAIVGAAVLYCLRCLIDEDIPMNQGVLAPVEIRLPPCLLNPPAGPTAAESPAVVGGNVETSQRVVDVLLGALKLAAASQGTMNNLLFGDASFGYYETICGGAGATPAGVGADAVHSHMTNTRLTDPEILEQRYPVRVRRFAVRRGSGGEGRHRGGDGVIREIEFLKHLRVSLLSQRRGPYAPYGLNGGKDGQLGMNRLQTADGRMVKIDALASFDVETGDRLIIETPGGGGWGEPSGD